MLAVYMIGLYIVVKPGTLSEESGHLRFAHFVVAVAISGSFSPLMYIHLKEAHDCNVLTASQILPSIQIASFPTSDVSWPLQVTGDFLIIPTRPAEKRQTKSSLELSKLTVVLILHARDASTLSIELGHVVV